MIYYVFKKETIWNFEPIPQFFNNELAKDYVIKINCCCKKQHCSVWHQETMK